MKRIRILAFLCVPPLLVILIRLFDLQLVQGPKIRRKLALRNIRVNLTPYKRCSISAKGKEILAHDERVLDLTTAPGDLYPGYASLCLLADLLDRGQRKHRLLKKNGEVRPRTERAPPAALRSGAELLARWRTQQGAVHIRLAQDLKGRDIRQLREACSKQGKTHFSFRREAGPSGAPAQWEVWIDISALGIQLKEGLTWENLFNLLLRGPPPSEEQSGSEACAGVLRKLGSILTPYGEADPLEAVQSELRRSFATEKEALVFEGVPESNWLRMRRHIALHRRFFQGVSLRSQRKGTFFKTSRLHRIYFKKRRKSVYQRFRRFFSGSGCGNAALEKQFRKNARRILKWIKRLREHTKDLYREKFMEKSEGRDAVTAWELAEAWRVRYLERALFSRQMAVLEDILACKQEAVRMVEILPPGFSISLRTRYKRRYPQGECVGSLVGLARPWEKTVDSRNKAELSQFQDTLAANSAFLERLRRASSIREIFHARRGDPPPLRIKSSLVGIQGLEKVYHRQLSGKAGLKAYKNGKRIRIPPLSGTSVRLTIDMDFTRFMYRKLREATQGFEVSRGLALFMDLESGALLCAVSYPSFDQEKYLSGEPGYHLWLEKHSRDSPFRSRCLYPKVPGSTFKLLLACAFLEEGGSSGYGVFCKGRGYEDYHCPNHGYPDHPWNLRQAIKRSCNHYFVVLGTGKLKRNKFVEWMDRLGLSGRPDYLPPGLIRKAPPDYRSIIRQVRYYMCYGGGEIEVLPLAMVRLVGAIARGGTVPRPRLRANTPVEVDALPLSENTCRIIRQAMRSVVNKPHGTAHNPAYGLYPSYSVAAKTGTAEVSVKTHQNNAWIVGFAPYENPRYSFAICLEHVDDGYHGGDTCGPVLAKALQYLNRRNPSLGLRQEAR